MMMMGIFVEGGLTIADTSGLGEDGDGPDRGVLDVLGHSDDLARLVGLGLLAAVDLEVEVAAVDVGVLRDEDVRVADRVAAHAQAVGHTGAVGELAEVPVQPVGEGHVADGEDVLDGRDLCRALRHRGGSRRGADGQEGCHDEGSTASHFGGRCCRLDIRDRL